jgi:OHCU decarboxylase
MTLAELNALQPSSLAEAEFARCCASARWASRMAAARPFTDLDALASAADRIWWSLDADDWLEAFAAHPRIGGRPTSAWSAGEQARAASAPDEMRERIALGNERYERTFGYTFLVCATGRSAEEILAALEARLSDDPDAELLVAAEEQRKITHLRLKKLVAPSTSEGA